MSEYIVTFHTHYDSLVCMRACEKDTLVQKGMLSIKLIPVPRALSSSCGTALQLQFTDDTLFNKNSFSDIEYDGIYKVNGETYTEI